MTWLALVSKETRKGRKGDREKFAASLDLWITD